MSYRVPSWPSAYTYRELYNRLVCMDGSDFHCEPKRHWTVICSFDINRKEGQILSVLPTNYRTPEKPEGYQFLEQFIVRVAVDQLYSQLDWLIENDNKNSAFWIDLKQFIPDFSLEPDSSADGSKEVPYTASNYNVFMLDFIHYQVEKGELSRDEIHLLLASNNIATELYEPDIKIFANYADADGLPSCPEEDIQYMWDEGIDVYYRRVGSKDRFSFGLLQATVVGKSETAEPPISITLMIDKIVVDKYAQSVEQKLRAKDVANAIFKLTDCIYANNCSDLDLLPVGSGGACEDRPSSNSLVYDVRKDSYYLNFHWPMAVLRQQPSEERAATITTTIQCMRMSNCIDSDVVNDKWETVFVTDELRGQVWIGSDLFKIEYSLGCLDERPSSKKQTRTVSERNQDVLKFRFSVTVGFFEFFSDEYTASPVLVEPRRNDRFKEATSDDQCPDDFQYDDGSPSHNHGNTSA